MFFPFPRKCATPSRISVVVAFIRGINEKAFALLQMPLRNGLNVSKIPLYPVISRRQKWALVSPGLVHACRQNRELASIESSAIVHKQVGNKSLVLQLPIDKNLKYMVSHRWWKTWDMFCDFSKCEASLRRNFKELMENVREIPSNF